MSQPESLHHRMSHLIMLIQLLWFSVHRESERSQGGVFNSTLFSIRNYTRNLFSFITALPNPEFDHFQVQQSLVCDIRNGSKMLNDIRKKMIHNH